MAQIKNLTIGQKLWDKHKYKMGNTTMRTWGVWDVIVKEIDPQHRFIFASWNGNPPRKMYGREVGKLKIKEPIIERNLF